MSSKHSAGSASRLTAAFGAVLLLALCARAAADDRDFVRKSVQNPYVFILLDVSGSMNWTPACSQAQFDAGLCPQVCTAAGGDCYAPMNGDSPTSKFFQAKSALYDVIRQVDNVQFGFFTYNQDRLGILHKHWMYQAQNTATWSCSGSNCNNNDQTFTYPVVGSREYFGFNWGCNSTDAGGNNVRTACNSGTPADVSDAWEINRARYLPKFGDVTNVSGQSTAVYIRTSGPSNTYKVTYTGNSGTLGGATVTVSMNIKYCRAPGDDTRCDRDLGTQTVTYSLVDQFLSWEFVPSRGPAQESFFNQGQATDHSVANTTCNGWDGNTDSSSDPYTGSDPYQDFNVRVPNASADPRGQAFTNGDVIPADYLDSKKGPILARLAPSPGGFGQAQYFTDHPSGGVLHLSDPNCDLGSANADANFACRRPLIANGSTPLGNSMSDFYDWLRSPTTGTNAGWRVRAAALDPQWGCRRKYLIVVTDGDDTCSNLDSVCQVAENLRLNESFRTFVVAYGVPANTGNALKCIAERGGQDDCTGCPNPPGDPNPAGCVPQDDPNFAQCGDGKGDPLYPQNRQELVDKLTDIFQQIKEEERAFASAAVPSVEANVKDKIFLSDFTPVSGASIWDGHLDAFLKPLPVLPDGTTPDDADGTVPGSRPSCTASGATVNCHLWDTSTMLVGQAPDLGATIPGTLDNATLKLSLNPDDRRVYFPSASGALQPFGPQAGWSTATWNDLFTGFGFDNPTGSGATFTANQARAIQIMGTTLNLKHETIDLASGSTQDITYVMGDVFHSDPLVTESPHDTVDYDAAAEPGQGDCRLGSGALPGKGSSSNYRCFASKEQNRRKLVVVGTNESELHAFDAGTFDATTSQFTNGTGKEAFAIVPRMAMPIVRDDAEDNVHIFGVDGPVVSADTFFSSANGGDDQWHTIAVIGMREGGRKLNGAMVTWPQEGATTGYPPLPGSPSDLSEPVREGYFALDVTQPDPLREEFDQRDTSKLRRFVPTTAGPVPGCAVLATSLNSGCERPFPSLLWEFTDRNPANGQPMDEDTNGDGDFGAPWSRPIVTRVKLAGGVVRPVVIVGGGLDTANKTATNPRFGNWIYMLDARTGVPIYKREVEGSVPAVSVLDSNQDNVADAVYFGTTAGRVYKIDLLSVQPVLTTITVKDRAGNNVSVSRVPAAQWVPFVVFQAGSPGPPAVTHPIYQEIQLLSVQKLGRYALAFGTGDRENLWNFDDIPGRMYVIVDEGWTAATGLNENNFTRIQPDDPQLTGASANPLLSPTGAFHKGWYIILDPSERVITQAFGVSGVLIFSSFQPQVIITDPGIDVICSRTGTSRNFVVYTINGNAVTSLSGGTNPERYISLPDFVTSPFVEQVQTQNVTGGGAPPPIPFDADCTNNARLNAVARVLQSNGPTNAVYGNYFLRLGQRESQRGVFYPACVPIGIVDRNWKEN